MAESMRVLHLVKTAVGATWALRQMRELVNLGVEVHVSLPQGPLVEKYEASGVIPHIFQADLPVRQLTGIPKLLRQMRQVVSNVKPDIIHSHFVGTTLTMRLALGRQHHIPRIFQVPGPLHLESEMFRRIEIASAGKLDNWIGSCQWTCDRYQQSGISEKQIYLSYYGTDIDQFIKRPGGKLRDELKLAPDVKIIGMVAFMYAPKFYLGQTRGLKGHEDLIDAIALCRQRGLQVVGVFIGGAWNNAIQYEERVRVYARKHCGDSIIFLGTRQDVPDLYPDFDIAIHPSHSENVGGAVESLLTAIPTIATNVGGFPDLVINGKTGWLVPPHSPSDLADAILETLSYPQLAQEKAIEGQQLARKLFDVRKTSQEILNIYRNILAN